MSTPSDLDLYKLTFSLPAGLDDDQAGLFASKLGQDALSNGLTRTGDNFNGPWEIQIVTYGRPDMTDVTAKISLLEKACGVAAFNIAVEKVPDINWLEHCYRQFPPFSVGPFFIYGSHYDGPVPGNLISLQIDAATAFGSGEHGTTSGCLMLLEWLKNKGFSPCTVLDMGCGSGILAIAARKIWNCDVLGVDIDPESVAVTDRHAALNGTPINTLAGDGFDVVSGSYDLIIANILPGPLKSMAADLMLHLKKGGHVILSGLLQDQTDGVLQIYRELGALPVHRADFGEWTALCLERR